MLHMSTVSFAPDQKRGHPSNKGSWSAYDNSLPESVLPTAPAERSHSPAGYTRLGGAPLSSVINEGFPQPQANSLEKVACVADAVAAGANTPEAIAAALDVHSREGDYYGNAAGYLGLVDTVPGESVTTYSLTSLGVLFTASDDAGRARIMQAVVAETPGVQILADESDEGLIDYLQETGLNKTTAQRRSSTITSWRQALSAADTFEAAASSERVETGSRAVVAALNASVARAERIERAARVPQVAFCGLCGMQMSAQGDCENC